MDAHTIYCSRIMIQALGVFGEILRQPLAEFMDPQKDDGFTFSKHVKYRTPSGTEINFEIMKGGYPSKTVNLFLTMGEVLLLDPVKVYLNIPESLAQNYLREQPHISEIAELPKGFDIEHREWTFPEETGRPGIRAVYEEDFGKYVSYPLRL